jgi:PAS domain S-box-containing protein
MSIPPAVGSFDGGPPIEQPGEDRFSLLGELPFSQIVQDLPAAVYMTDAEGRLMFYNEAAASLWGRRPRLGEERWCGSWQRYRPDGTPMPDREYPLAVTLKTGKAVRDCEAIAARPDGTRYHFLTHPTLLRDAEGKILGAVNLLVDITERKRAEEVKWLLLRELQHRVKNSLATVQAIAAQTFRTSPEAERMSFAGRIQALAHAHDLLTGDNSHRGEVKDIVESALAPFGRRESECFQIEGPQASINANNSLMLAMILHELGTNAVKYGALSKEEGRVSIKWEMLEREHGPALSLHWRESGGPEVKPPKRKGFGSTLIERVLDGQHGHADMEYAPSGIICALTLCAERSQQ